MGWEFRWQLKLPVAVSTVKILKFHKSKDQLKYVLYARRKYLFCDNEVYVLYARRKYLFCDNEVYKVIKQHTKSVLTFIDDMGSYIMGAN